MRHIAASGTAVLALTLVASAALAQPRSGKRVPEAKLAEATAQLVGADARAAVAAAAILGSATNQAATSSLTTGLVLGLSPEVAGAALAALAARADESAFPVLEYYMKVRRKSLRAAAARALLPLRDVKVNAVLVAALADPSKEVRAEVANALAARKAPGAAQALMALMIKGELSAAKALAAMADAEIARDVAELIGRAPNDAIAEALGEMLLRDDFGPDTLRVEVVRALGKLPSNAGVEKLATYVASTPEKPPRESRREAELLLSERL